MSSDLMAFIKTRLDEDEQIAQAAGAGIWYRLCTCRIRDGEQLPQSHWRCCVVRGDIHLYDEGGHDGDQAEHIARHDPARVLREVAAKRKLLTYFVEEIVDCTCEAYGHYEIMGLLLLAACWSDHPDYRDEWRVA